MKKRITISEKYPRYWEYDGKAVVLLGGSKEDNLFQIPDLEEHLRLLKSAGGNYIRCTMSSRDPGDVWPYQLKEGKYDLDRFSDEYWGRFSRLLKLTYEMDIIVQIELWDRFDFAREPWQDNPFNPKNNRNYSSEESRLKEEINSHPGQNENRFFFSIPEEDNNILLLKYQEAYVDKLLSHSLEYPHVLYCMDNETNGAEGWGRYWALYIQKKAKEKGLTVHTTEMWDAWDLSSEEHGRTFDHPELYSFCDVSQNNHNSGDEHWNGLMYCLKRTAALKRPMNNVKIYGSDSSRFGSQQDALERFWRNIFGGAAAARFHRPESGIGLSLAAQKHIRCMRKFLDEIRIFECEPHNELIQRREKDSAY